MAAQPFAARRRRRLLTLVGGAYVSINEFTSIHGGEGDDGQVQGPFGIRSLMHFSGHIPLISTCLKCLQSLAADVG